jgi:ABC-type uncharacterized transport system substrate-binding protein
VKGLTLVLGLLAAAAALHGRDTKVVIIRASALPIYEQAVVGFKRCLMTGAQPRVYTMPPSTDPKSLEEFLAEIRAGGGQLVLALGTSAALFAQEKLSRLVPTMFCMVLDPESSNLRLPGVAMDVKPSTQVDFIKKNFPQFKRIGVVYNPDRNAKVIADLKSLQQKGVDLVMAESRSYTETAGAVKSLIGRADCMVMLFDPSIYSHHMVTDLMLTSLQNNLPIIAGSEGYVRAGALAGVYSSPEDMGCMAGEMADRLIFGEDPAGVGVRWPTKTRSAVNLVVAERLKVKMDPSLVQSSDLVVK